MTKAAKAKTKSCKVWVAVDQSGEASFSCVGSRRFVSKGRACRITGSTWPALYRTGWRLNRATLTWTPPAKKRAKR